MSAKSIALIVFAVCVLLALTSSVNANKIDDLRNKLKDCWGKVDKKHFRDSELKVVEKCIPKAFLPPVLVPQVIASKFLKCVLVKNLTGPGGEAVRNVAKCMQS